jgi:hypothetical protein
MKVTFKLTTEQLLAFQKAMPAHMEQLDCLKNSSYPFNTDQKLTLNGMFLTYRGQRCPFVQDGTLTLIRDLGETEVVAYETSDTRLQWFETMAGAIESRPEQFSMAERLKYHSGYYQRYPKIIVSEDDGALYRASLSYNLTMSETLMVKRHVEVNCLRYL